jgi:hypothetical protein
MATTTVTISNEFVDYVKSRFDFASSGVEEILNRYQQLITIEKRKLGLSKNEIMLIIDSLNSTMKDMMVVQMMHASVEDSCHYDNLDKKWEVDGKVLAEKIKNMNNLQRLAILDGVEYYWKNSHLDSDELLRKSGLWREEI